MKTIPIHGGLRGLFGWRAIHSQHEPVLFTRDGTPDLIVVPVDDRLEGLALTRSDAFLADIDRAEQQIKDGTMVSLEDAVLRLDLGDAQAARATIEVGAPITDIITYWFPKGSAIDFTGSYMDGELVAAEAFDPDGSLLTSHGKPLGPAFGEAATSMMLTGLSVSLQRTGTRRTEISVTAPAAGNINSPDMQGAVVYALGAVKDDVERSAPRFRRRGRLALLARGR